MPIRGDLLRSCVNHGPSAAEEALGCIHIPGRAEHGIHQIAIAVNRAIEITPLVGIPMKEIACSDPMSIRIRAQRSWQFHVDGLIDMSQEKWDGGRSLVVATGMLISFLHSAHCGS